MSTATPNYDLVKQTLNENPNAWGTVLNQNFDKIDAGMTANRHVAQLNVLFVGKHGNDTNDGTSPNRAFLTFGAALAAAAGQSPSASNRFAVVCVDGGIYNENVVGLANVDIHAPDATLEEASGTVLRVAGETTSEFGYIRSTGTGPVVLMPNAATGTAQVFAKIITTGIGAQGILNVAVTGVGVLIVKANQIYVNSAVGVGELTAEDAHTHVEVEDIYLVAAGAVAVSRFSTGNTILRAGHILESGAAVGTGTGFRVLNGTIDAQVGALVTNTAYNLGVLGTLNLFANEITGGTVVAPSSVENVETAGYLAANPIDWASPPPTTKQAAIDRLASAVAILLGGPIP